jgi:membrane protein
VEVPAGTEPIRPITEDQRPRRLAGIRVDALPEPARWLARLAIQTFRRWRADRCVQEAAALAFKTSLCLVPLCAVAFALLKAANKLDERSALLEFFASNLFPAEEARATVMQPLLTFADNIESGVMGPGGLAVLIVLTFLLFRDIQTFFGRVWAAQGKRSLFRSFAIFYMLATLVPFLLAISLYHTAHYWRGGVAGFLAPLASSFLALLAANRLLPSVRVQWRFAALGAGLSAVLYEAAKIVFARYVVLVLTKYHSIYGAFGLVPLVLVWIYVGWLIVLLGAEVAHCAQRLDAIEAGDRRKSDDEAWELVTGTTAARLVVEVARHFSTDGKASPAPELAEKLRLPEEVVARVLGRLKRYSLLVEVEGDVQGWLPARPLTAIRLDEVLAAFRVTRASAGNRADRLGRLLTEIDPVTNEKSAVTLDQLLD